MMANDWTKNLPGAVDVSPTQQGEKKDSVPMDAMSFAKGIARSIGQGVTFGFADEAEAYARSIIGDESYEEAKKATRKELDQFRSANPWYAYGSEIAAAILSPGAYLRFAAKVPALASAASKAMRATGPTQRAAIGGGLYGAGTAPEIKDVPAGMATGAALGAGLQQLAPVVGEGAKRLMARGIPLTVGQKFGGVLGMVEEGLSKIPVGAEIIGPTRRKAIERFATATYNEALKPLGKSVSGDLPPRKAAAEAQKIFKQSYDDALDGVEINIGAGFLDDIEAALAPFRAELPKKMVDQIDNLITNQIKNRAPDNKLTGKAVQDIQKKLGELSNDFLKSGDAYQRRLGKAMQTIDGEMMDLLAKYYPAKAAQLQKTNEAYALYYPVRRAATSAGVKENVFTPAKLLSAVRGEEVKTAGGLNRMERGEARLQTFAEDAAEAIGAKVPESAPLRTAATILGLGGGGLAGAIDPVTAGIGLGAGKLIYTPAGQYLTSKAIETASRGMRSPAAGGLLAEQAAPYVSPISESLLGIGEARAEPPAPKPESWTEQTTDRLGNPITILYTQGGANAQVIRP